MTTFTTTGTTSHSSSISGFGNGGSYTYYVKCQDAYTNTNPDDYTISFSVDMPHGSGGILSYVPPTTPATSSTPSNTSEPSQSSPEQTEQATTPSSATVCNTGDLFSTVTGLPCHSSVELPVLNTSCSLTSTLGLGWYGSEVKCLQTILNITSDGIFGPKTKTAVILFQKAHNLAPDGIVGPLTRNKLK